MKRKSLWMRVVALFIATLLSLPLEAMAQEAGAPPQQKLSKEELAQLLAPIALYPDELIVQILMASTYPLEVVQADRWVQQNKGLKGDALTKALEKEKWDPSVKSLVNFPSVLSVMSQKLDLTTKIGDAFLSQEQDVMGVIQELRRKAYDAGNLKTTQEQKVVVEKETIVIQPANPQVVYVPTYSPTVVYGTWAYPAYPPYYYYPPPPAYSPLFTFAAGVAVGAAWGYAWGNCNWGGNNWHGNNVYINHNQNMNINNNINRGKYKADFERRSGGSGEWRHDPSHRKGVAYRDNATAKKFGQSPSRSMQGRRDARGYGEGRGGGQGGRPSAGTMDRGAGRVGDRGAGARPSAGTMDRGAGGGAERGGGQRASAGSMDRGGAAGRGGRDSAFSGGFGSGRQERTASERGQSSRQSSGFSRSGGGGFGGGGGGRGGFGGGGGGRRR